MTFIILAAHLLHTVPHHAPRPRAGCPVFGNAYNRAVCDLYRGGMIRRWW